MDEKKAEIFIVEDEPEILNINARLLARRGYSVTTAQSYAESIQKLSEFTPDMLILDIMLPDGSGMDICRKPLCCFRNEISCMYHISNLHHRSRWFSNVLSKRNDHFLHIQICDQLRLHMEYIV